MSGTEPVDTERTVVTTYVPAYQKSEWKRHAEGLDMSLSEFVRSMVQAGRRGFGADMDVDAPTGERSAPSDSPDGEIHDRGNGPSAASTPGGNIEEMVLHTLETEGPLDWEGLVDEVVGDLEDELEDAVMTLTEQGEITHRPRRGVYTRPEE